MAPETLRITPYNPSPFQYGTTIKVCLIVSFLFHAVTILAFHDVINLNWTVEKPRTYKVDLIRTPVEDLDPDDPIVLPIKKDFRYRGWKDIVQPQHNALIIYMMDVSGSMGDEQKEIVRVESFWIDTWLRSQYKGIETRFIIHDASARMVDRETFFRTKESGGTLISSAYKLCNMLIDREFSPLDWNIYPLRRYVHTFHTRRHLITSSAGALFLLCSDSCLPRHFDPGHTQLHDTGSGSFHTGSTAPR